MKRTRLRKINEDRRRCRIRNRDSCEDDCTNKTPERPPRVNDSQRPQPTVPNQPENPFQTPLPEDLSDPPTSAALMAGGIIATSLIIAALSDSGWWTACGATAVAIGSAIWLQRQATERRERLHRTMDSYRQETDKWQHRWMKLQQEAQQTASALQKMRDGVILLSHTGEVLLINPSARLLLAIPDDAVIDGRPLSEVVRIPEFTRSIAAAASGDGTQKFQLEVANGDTPRPVKVRVDPIAARVETKLLITIRDETEANRVDEMRREFVANISHELKTPLAAIKGYAETVELAIEDDPNAAKHFMSQIHSQCLRLERLIADMMQLARAQSGRAHLTITRVDIAAVVAESLRSNLPIAETKNINLVYSDDDKAIVMSDLEATLTIANNLIGNAVRYTSSGGHVKVSFRDAGRFLALVVEDDGVGISAVDQKRIFERFYRVAKSRRSAGEAGNSGTEGTGIGLSIVKNLTLALGGEIRLTSQPGEGARFEVLLPKVVPARQSA